MVSLDEGARPRASQRRLSQAKVNSNRGTSPGSAEETRKESITDVDRLAVRNNASQTYYKPY